MNVATDVPKTLLLATAALGLAACAGAPRESSAARLADAAVAARVEAALLQDPDLYARHIDVDAERGVVYLSGYVWSVNELVEAERVAANVAGAERVASRIELMVGGRSGAR